MAQLINPLGYLLSSFIFWFLAFDVAVNYDFIFLNVILMGMALACLVGFLFDAYDLLKSGTSVSGDS